MAFHVWKKALGCTTFQPHWKAFFNPKAPLLAQKNDALRLTFDAYASAVQNIIRSRYLVLSEYRAAANLESPHVRL